MTIPVSEEDFCKRKEIPEILDCFEIILSKTWWKADINLQNAKVNRTSDLD